MLGDVHQNDGEKEVCDNRVARIYEIDSQSMRDWK